MEVLKEKPKKPVQLPALKQCKDMKKFTVNPNLLLVSSIERTA
jgi:hypothetical protein